MFPMNAFLIATELICNFSDPYLLFILSTQVYLKCIYYLDLLKKMVCYKLRNNQLYNRKLLNQKLALDFNIYQLEESFESNDHLLNQCRKYVEYKNFNMFHTNAPKTAIKSVFRFSNPQSLSLYERSLMRPLNWFICDATPDKLSDR